MNAPTTRVIERVDDTVVVRHQNVGAILDGIAERRAVGAIGKPDFRHAATVPEVVIEHYCNVNGVSFSEFCRNPEHMRRLLNSPEFADLRIWQGKL